MPKPSRTVSLLDPSTSIALPRTSRRSSLLDFITLLTWSLAALAASRLRRNFSCLFHSRCSACCSRCLAVICSGVNPARDLFGLVRGRYFFLGVEVVLPRLRDSAREAELLPVAVMAVIARPWAIPVRHAVFVMGDLKGETATTVELPPEWKNELLLGAVGEVGCVESPVRMDSAADADADAGAGAKGVLVGTNGGTSAIM